MISSVGAYRKIIEDYFFENDEVGKIHVYQNHSLEYYDTIEVGYRYEFEEFEILCNEWIDNNKK